ncbi:MAG: hypothetical protein ABIJ86_12035, partial [Spirochaetota bacterium]
GSYLNVYDNNALTAFTMDELDTLGAHFDFAENNALVNFPDFAALTVIPSYLNISGNNMLATMGLVNLTTVTTNLTITSNPSLQIVDITAWRDGTDGTPAVTVSGTTNISGNGGQ